MRRLFAILALCALAASPAAALQLIVAGAGTLPAPPADTIPATLFGMQYQGSNDYPSVPFGIIGKGSGVVWPYVQKTNGSTYDWSALDAFVSDASTHSLPIMYTFEYVPGWAVADHSSGCTDIATGVTACAKKPDSLTDLHNFIGAFLGRYCPGGVPSIQYFELYNEPYDTLASHQLAAADLATMTHAIHGDIKASCPAMQIVSPSWGPYNGNGNTASSFIPDYAQSYYTALGAAGTDLVDVASVHMYTNEPGGLTMTPEDLASGGGLNDPAMAAILATYAPAAPIWNTEGSWGENTLSSDAEAGFIARWYLLHWSVGYKSANWYQWDNNSFGTLCPSVSGPCTPTAALKTAYEQTYDWMVGRVMAAPCSKSGTVWTCGFTGASATGGAPCAASTAALAVWDTSGSSSYTPPGGYSKYCDLAGGVTAYTSGAVTIGIKPILFGS